MSQNNKIIFPFGRGIKKWTISRPSATDTIAEKPPARDRAGSVDLVFVIDTTGSMSDKIDGLLKTCAQFVDEFDSLSLDHRIAIVAFGDLTVPGDNIVATEFTPKVEVIKKSLRNIPRYSGGGNEGESSLEALQKTLRLTFRPDAVKVLLLITDEPAHQRQLRAADMIKELLKREFMAFVISPPHSYFKEMARQTGGKWYRVAANTKLTDLLNMFRKIAANVSRVVSDVYQIGDGSVSKYLQLKPPEK